MMGCCRNWFVNLAVLIAASAWCSLAGAQAVETFQVPDLPPPVAPSPGAEDIPAPGQPYVEDAIPAPSVYPQSALSLLDNPPVPYPYPAAHLWAGHCGHEETLIEPSACPAVWASVDALWLQRDGVDGRPLAIDDPPEVVLRADDFDFDYQAGVRVVYGEVVNCTPVELTYFGTYDWNSSIAYNGTELDVPFGPQGGAFTDADFVAANYASELHSIEVNVLQQKTCNVTWLGGVRYIDAEEDFLLRVDNTQDGLLAIANENRLLGLQAGADAQYGCNGWCFGLTAKAGAYLNFAERDVLLRDGVLGLDESFEAAHTDIAFVGEAIFGVTRHLGCGVKLRGGYQVLWLQGVALAPEQLGNRLAGPAFAPPAVDTDGATLYDGGYIGVEWHR